MGDEDFKVDEMDFTNLSVKYNSCATHGELDEDGNQVYTGLVTFKVKNHNDGTSTAFVTGIDNYVGIALEHAKTIRDFECDLCEMEQTENYCAHLGYAMEEEEEEEEEEITEVCQKVFEEGSTFGCYTDINECAGTSESNVITCKYLSEIGTADSEIAMVGDEELVDSEGNTLHAWDIVRLEAQGASTGAKVWTALMVASTTALGVLAC